MKLLLIYLAASSLPRLAAPRPESTAAPWCASGSLRQTTPTKYTCCSLAGFDKFRCVEKCMVAKFIDNRWMCVPIRRLCVTAGDTHCQVPPLGTTLTHRSWPPLDRARELLVFLHLPHAGSALEPLYEAWSGGGLSDGGDQLDFAALRSDEQAKYSVLWGHRRMGLEHKLRGHASRRIHYATLVREPIARTVAQYVYEAARRRTACATKCVIPSLLAWFHRTRVGRRGPWAQRSNPLARQLCCWWHPSLRNATKPMWMHSAALRSTDLARNATALECPASPAALLRCAKATIDRMLAVGIYEKLAESIALLRHRTGLPPQQRGAAALVNPAVTALSAHTLVWEEEAQLRVALEVDLELYAYARDTFELQRLELLAGVEPRPLTLAPVTAYERDTAIAAPAPPPAALCTLPAQSSARGRACSSPAAWCRSGRVCARCCCAVKDVGCDCCKAPEPLGLGLPACLALDEVNCQMSGGAAAAASPTTRAIIPERHLTRRFWKPLDLEREILVFIHVPKTAGSVVKKLLIRWGKHLGRSIGHHRVEFLALSKAEQQDHVALWGHRGYGVHEQPGYKIAKTPRYFTFLRDPVARTISQYAFQMRALQRDCADCTLPSFLDWFHTSNAGQDGPWSQQRNPMCRQICCWWTPHTPKHERPARGWPCPSSPSALLECAKRRLDTFVMVGVQSQLEAGLEVLASRTGLVDKRSAKERGGVNVAPSAGKPRLTAEEEAHVRLALREDFALYAYAERLFKLQHLELNADVQGGNPTCVDSRAPVVVRVGAVRRGNSDEEEGAVAVDVDQGASCGVLPVCAAGGGARTMMQRVAAGDTVKVEGEAAKIAVLRVASVEAPWSPRGVGGGAASGWPIVRLVLDAPRNALLLAGAKVCVVAEGDEEGAVKEGKKSFQVS